VKPIIVERTVCVNKGPSTPAKRAKRSVIHPGDAEHARRIAQAIGYTIRFYKAPCISFGERAKTLTEAVAIARRLNTDHGQHGRRAVIYATQPDGRASVPVPYKEKEE
jgi:hypothetical protein